MRKMILRERKGSFQDHIMKGQELTFESRFLALKSMLFLLYHPASLLMGSLDSEPYKLTLEYYLTA